MRIGTIASIFVLGFALAPAARAAAVDITLNFDKDGQSTGTCAGSICPTSIGTATIIGDTTSSLIYTIDLASGVSFQHPDGPAGKTQNKLFFQLTAGANTITFSDETTGGTNFTWGTPVSGSFSETGNFPGTYNFGVPCTQTASATLCGSTLTFTANGASVANPFVIGSPVGAGDFPGIPITLVADLSIAAGTAGLCPGTAACTGLVGTNFTSSAIPEPSTWAMMLIGFAGLAFAGYRRATNNRFALSTE